MQLPLKPSHQDPRSRPPRLYKTAAKILREFIEGKDSVKNLVFSTREVKFGGKPRPKHPNTKALFALVSNAVNHKSQLDAATAKMELFTLEPKLNQELAAILITELIWGKGELPGESPPVVTVLKYKKRIKKCVDKDGGVDGRTLSENWPRYARINSLLATRKEVERVLESEGWNQVSYDSSTDYATFLSLVSSLPTLHYINDFHLEDVLVFPPQTPLYEHKLVTDGLLMLQDKASCLPVTCLSPPPGSTVLDSCSAPGMKTSQLAGAVCGTWRANSLLGSTEPPSGARVIAVEKSSKRAVTLREILAKSNADKVTTVLNCDFLEVKPSDYPQVEYLVVDPSCSGTGMALRGGEDTMEPDMERLERLAGLQTRLLSHALSFPGARRVVYSTCATSTIENEAVVDTVLNKWPSWKVKSVLPTWERRGRYYQGMERTEYLRADSEQDLCNGFFVAVLENMGDKEENGEEKEKVKNKKKKEYESNCEIENAACDLEDEIVKKKKNKKEKKQSVAQIPIEEELNELDIEKGDKKKKKSKKEKKAKMEMDLEEVIECNDLESENTNEKKKKNKKEKKEEHVSSSVEKIENCDMENEKAKKKKKNKNKEDRDQDIENETKEQVYAEEQPTEKKKKKKSKSDCEDEIIAEVSVNKKKKKRKSEEIDTESVSNGEEAKKTKRKKSDIEETEESVNVTDEVVKKHKKKKKSKE